MSTAKRQQSEACVLLYEDDEVLASEITGALLEEGQRVVRVHDDVGLETMPEGGARNVLVLDRMVDGRDSLDHLAAMRARGDRTPVLVISSLASVDERIRGLKAGGDDYLIKPFAMGELLARVAALRRRIEAEPVTNLVAGALSMDLITRKVWRDGAAITLLPREYALLEYLMRHADQVVTRTMLLEDVWQYNAATHTNVVDVHIGNLRRKIEANDKDKLIVSVRGIGFKFVTTDG